MTKYKECTREEALENWDVAEAEISCYGRDSWNRIKHFKVSALFENDFKYRIPIEPEKPWQEELWEIVKTGYIKLKESESKTRTVLISWNYELKESCLYILKPYMEEGLYKMETVTFDWVKENLESAPGPEVKTWEKGND